MDPSTHSQGEAGLAQGDKQASDKRISPAVAASQFQARGRFRRMRRAAVLTVAAVALLAAGVGFAVNSNINAGSSGVIETSLPRIPAGEVVQSGNAQASSLRSPALEHAASSQALDEEDASLKEHGASTAPRQAEAASEGAAGDSAPAQAASGSEGPVGAFGEEAAASGEDRADDLDARLPSGSSGVAALPVEGQGEDSASGEVGGPDGATDAQQGSPAATPVQQPGPLSEPEPAQEGAETGDVQPAQPAAQASADTPAASQGDDAPAALDDVHLQGELAPAAGEVLASEVDADEGHEEPLGQQASDAYGGFPQPEAAAGASSASPSREDPVSAPGQEQRIAVAVSVTSDAVGNPVSMSATVSLAPGSSAYDALCALGVGVDARSTQYGIYVAGIGGLVEKQHGGASGWLYAVNGVTPPRSAAAYVLSDGDSVNWFYTV